MVIPFREINENDKELIKIEEKKNKKRSLTFIIIGILGIMIFAIFAVVSFMDYEVAGGLFVLALGLVAGIIFIIVGIKSNKPLTGICEATITGMDVHKKAADNDEGVIIEYYLSFIVPGNENPFRLEVGVSDYKQAAIGETAYILKNSKGLIRVFVPNKREKKAIEKGN